MASWAPPTLAEVNSSGQLCWHGGNMFSKTLSYNYAGKMAKWYNHAGREGSWRRSCADKVEACTANLLTLKYHLPFSGTAVAWHICWHTEPLLSPSSQQHDHDGRTKQHKKSKAKLCFLLGHWYRRFCQTSFNSKDPVV